jgi:small subunit ribosomal protein S20e
MADDKDKTKDGEIQQEMQRCRMTLRCRDTKPLEDTCKTIIQRASVNYKTKGPVRIPTKKLSITTRRSPCGNGTNTWDRYEMRIHKRYIDIFCPASAIKEITDFRIDTGVDVNMLMY